MIKVDWVRPPNALQAVNDGGVEGRVTLALLPGFRHRPHLAVLLGQDDQFCILVRHVSVGTRGNRLHENNQDYLTLPKFEDY
jgi:hypothetical protein